MPFACIFVPDFPVEALLRAEPELRAQSFVVLEGKAPLQKVFAVNENARRDGVYPGMTKIQVEACSQIVWRMRSPLQEALAHAALLDCAQSFSPHVEDTALDAVVIDLAGMESLFGELSTIACAIARQASNLGLKANVAIASNPDAARLVSQGFPGVTLVPQGKEAEQLGGLPIEILFMQSSAEAEPFLETFHRWGIRNLRQLAALPEIELSERMGQQGVYWQKLARGATTRTLVPYDAPMIFEEAVELEYPILLLEPLAFLLNRLLEQLCSRLAARALATQELKLTFELENGTHGEEIAWRDVGTGAPRTKARQQFHRTLHLPVPLLDPKTFLKLLQLDLKGHPPGAPIIKIHLAAEPVHPRPGQGGLFLPPSPEPEKLELTIARIAEIVGEDKVGSVEMRDTHRPEGFCIKRFGHRASAADAKARGKDEFRTLSAQSGEACSSAEDLVTALRLFRPKVAVKVVMCDGKPGRITCPGGKGIDGEILWAAGPWRSSGDWWENEGWARDEWDIAIPGESGIALYRLVRDLLSGKWLVEGSYD